MSKDLVIETIDLNKAFKSKKKHNFFRDLFKPDVEQVRVIKKLNLQIEKGESVALLGPNGAGKTTTAKLLSGLLHPTSGSISVLGYKPSERNADFLTQISLAMGNKAGLDWDLTARQSFELLKVIYKIEEEVFNERLGRLTQMLDIKEKLDLQMRRLSLGERMKLELIGALLHNPKVLFLDEPTIGLDIDSKNTIRRFLRELNQNHDITLLLTSHDMDDIEQVCHRVIIINKGELIYDDSLSSLIKRYNRSRYIRFHFKNEIDLSQLKEYGKVEAEDNGILLRTTNNKFVTALSEIPYKYDVDDVNIESIPLERIVSDIFANSK